MDNHWCPVKVEISIKDDFMRCIEFFCFFFKISPPYKNTDKIDREGARPDEHHSDGVEKQNLFTGH